MYIHICKYIKYELCKFDIYLFLFENTLFIYFRKYWILGNVYVNMPSVLPDRLYEHLPEHLTEPLTEDFDTRGAPRSSQMLWRQKRLRRCSRICLRKSFRTYNINIINYKYKYETIKKYT